MKSLLQIILISLLFTLPASSNAAEKPANQDKLGFMKALPFDKIQEYAKIDRKPILLYFHSKTCITSRQFTREVISTSTVKGTIRKHFVSMNADVSSKEGKNTAQKFNVYTLPAVVLISADGELEYVCELKMDTGVFNGLISSFFSACNIYNSINDLKQTNGITFNEAANRIGASYAKRDFKNNTFASADLMAHQRTLDLPELSEANEGYMKEWENQKIALEGDKNKNSKVAKSNN
ncbi:MAG: thioredoxin family protein [Bacteroidota bacterium]|nr:thioredoxin family protein [Bacteroidota bacterium]